LKKLDLSHCEDIEEEFLEELFSKTTQLEELVLADNTVIEGEAFQNFNPSYLKKLDLSGCIELNEDLLQDFFNKAKSLLSINFTSTNITGKAFQNFDPSNLKFLFLGGCYNLDKGVIEVFISKIKEPKTLVISGSFEISINN